MGTTSTALIKTWGSPTEELYKMTERIFFFVFCILLVLLPLGSTECTMDDFLKCDREIQRALEECAHVTTQAEWQTCLNDIINIVVEADCEHCFCAQFPDFCSSN